MKKSLLSISLIGLILVCLFIYYVHLGTDAQQGRNNIKNARKIIIGMDSTNVVSIMGKPFYIWQTNNEKIFVYDTPPLYSESIQIIFDSTGQVIQFGPTYSDD